MSANTIVLAILFLLAGTSTLAHGETPPPLNIVFILIDDLGAHDLGCTGSTFHRTPHIDALARSGRSHGSASMPPAQSASATSRATAPEPGGRRRGRVPCVLSRLLSG